MYMINIGFWFIYFLSSVVYEKTQVKFLFKLQSGFDENGESW